MILYNKLLQNIKQFQDFYAFKKNLSKNNMSNKFLVLANGI